MGSCKKHNWNSKGFMRCPHCVTEDNQKRKSEENTMSKMSELDIQTRTAIYEVAEQLMRWVTDRPSMHIESMTKSSVTEMFVAFLEGDEDESATHDWIDEALHRRVECASYIEKLALVQAELTLMHTNFRSQGDELNELREWCDRRSWVDDEDYPDEDVSGSTNTNTGFAKPANGYVMLCTDNDSWCKYSSLDELITDSVPAFFDARGFNNGNQVYELGMQVRPVAEIKWEKVK
jgi:hypothetical protein